MEDFKKITGYNENIPRSVASNRTYLTKPMKKLKLIPKEEDKIPTAKEYLKTAPVNPTLDEVETYLIEFTKIIVKKALGQAAQKARIIEKWDDKEGEYYDAVDKRSIVNAYPLTNIK